MLYMVIEEFVRGPEPVYARFREQGRLAPDGLHYVGSWVGRDMDRCYQIMECADRALLDEWIRQWSDIVSFAVIPVITSVEAASRMSRHE
jgi:hypothetical protein